MKVVALQDGFYNGARVRAGTEFVLRAPEKPGKWMRVVDAQVADQAEDQPEVQADIAQADTPKAVKPKAVKAEK